MISIIVPVKNGERYLHGCINSLLAQDIRDIEVIIADDRSSDGTARLAENFCRADSRVKYILCENGGVSSARNSGLAAAQGEWIFFADSDDTLFNHSLSTLLSRAKRHDADITACNIMLSYSKKSRPQCGEGDALAKRGQIARLFYNMLPSYVMFNVFKLYKRVFLTENGVSFDAALSLGEDLVFNIAAFSAAKTVCYVSEPLYLHRMRKNGLNFRYRPELPEIKARLYGEIKDYLAQNDTVGDNLYEVLLNDIFALIVNEAKSQSPDIEKILNHDLTAELTKKGAPKHLSPAKRAVFFLIKQKAKRALLFSASLANL